MASVAAPILRRAPTMVDDSLAPSETHHDCFTSIPALSQAPSPGVGSTPTVVAGYERSRTTRRRASHPPPYTWTGVRLWGTSCTRPTLDHLLMRPWRLRGLPTPIKPISASALIRVPSRSTENSSRENLRISNTVRPTVRRRLKLPACKPPAVCLTP